MLLALFSSHLASSVQALDFVEPLYFEGEYVFAVLLWLGFATFPEHKFSARRIVYYMLPIIVIWSVALSITGDTFGDRFTVHSIAFILALVPAWIALYRLDVPAHHVWVKLAAITSLTLLILNLMLNAGPVFTGDWARGAIHDSYFAYQSIFDLMFEVLLAFSLLVIAAVNMKGELEQANQILKGERDNMSILAKRDALTGCLNRHAMDELQRRLRNRSGL